MRFSLSLLFSCASLGAPALGGGSPGRAVLDDGTTWRANFTWRTHGGKRFRGVT